MEIGMEMPEGWKRFYTDVYDGESQTYEDLRSLEILLKELTEALEEIVNPEIKPSIKYDPNPSEIREPLQFKAGGLERPLFSKASVALKKFKEWK